MVFGVVDDDAGGVVGCMHWLAWALMQGGVRFPVCVSQ